MSNNRYTPPNSAYVWGNASGGAAVAASGYSAPLDTWDSPFVTICGTSSGTSTITVLGSNDGVNYFQLATISATSTAGSLYLALTCGVEFIKLQSSAAVTLQVVISAKG